LLARAVRFVEETLAEGRTPVLVAAPVGATQALLAALAPHRVRTVQRMMAQATVLCIQDGTDLNYNQLEGCIGLGVLGKNQTGAKTRGLHLHSTFVVSTGGLPLGVLNAQFSAPQPRSGADTRPAASIPIEEKKTHLLD